MSIAGPLANQELDVDRQLVAREAHRLGGLCLRHARHLEQDASGADDRDPVVGRALAGAHPDLGGLLGHRLVREDPDPDLATAPDVSGHGASRGLDLAAGDVGRLLRHEREVAEGDRVATLGGAAHPTALLLAVLDSTGHQHGYAPPAAGAAASRAGVPLGEDVAAVDPDLHADRAVGGPRQHLAVADVRTQGAQGDAPFLLPLAPRHLRAAEATRDRDLHALGAGLHGPLHGLLDGLAEGDPARELLGDVRRHEDRIELRLADLLDLQLDLAGRDATDRLAQRLDVGAALADDDARLGRVDRDRHVVDATLDLDEADARVREPPMHQPADRHVLLEEGRVVLVGVPLGVPGARDAQPEAVGMDLVTHASGLPALDHDGHVGHRLVDGERTALGTRSETLDGRTLIGDGRLDDTGRRATGRSCSRRWPWRS